MFKPDLRVLSPPGFLKRIGATGELPPPTEAAGREPAANLEDVGPRPARTRTLDGFSGSREWQAAVERLTGGQAQQGAEESGLARPAAAPPGSATRAPSRFKPETGDDDGPEHLGGKAVGQLPDDLARKVGGDPETRRGLEALVARGLADRPDSQGVTVLDHLRAILAMPAKKDPPNPVAVVRSLVDGLLSPHGIQQGKGTFSCTAATIQGLTASSAPGEYVRVLRGLMFDGQVRIDP
ncbi:MAG: hypothetical protein FJY99_09030 [Candidatus Sericytochromatia bacterium]|nr:hypothetical protein [Candidatus Tanganyikabacteria bacterium]